MKTHFKISNIKPEINSCILTIGNFDGLHLGHQYLLRKVLSKARKKLVESVVLSFSNHTQRVTGRANFKRVINGELEKGYLLDNLGIDRLVLVKFSKQMARISQRDFFKKWILKKFKPLELVVGYNHKFGYDGSIKKLLQLGRESDVKINIVPPFIIDNIAVSSTRIRGLIKKGDLPEVKRLLGYPLLIMGKVVAGMGLSRKIGFPSANLEIDWKSRLLPPLGVYAGYALWKSGKGKCVINIGSSPTRNISSRRMEVHIIGCKASLYGKILKIWIMNKIRDIMIFPDLEALTCQIQEDIKKTSKFSFPRRKIYE
ncbi:MAG: riboflavin biosynthesis protein RibF [bacterium]